MRCLRNQTAKTLLHEVHQLLGFRSASFIPISGDTLLPKYPFQEWDKATVEPLELLIGTNDEEGTYFLQRMYQAMGIANPFQVTIRQHITIIKLLMNYALWEAPQDLVNRLLVNITEGTSTQDVVHYLAHGIGDVAMRCPTMYFSDFLARHNSTVYCYEYGYKPEKGSFWPPWMGVTHFDEFPFVWGYVLDRPEVASSRDQEYSKHLIDLWSSFMKTG